MSMNKYMHKRNRYYNRPPNFAFLASHYPEFRELCLLNLDGSCSFLKKSIQNEVILNKVLLKEDFDLNIELPRATLLPSLSLRLNYMHWIEDIMSTMKINNPTGIDIGCGASCIYALLMAKTNKWKMLALEVNEENFEYAKKNIKFNNLDNMIGTYQQKNKNEIFKPYFSEHVDVKYDFCVCNPPFFEKASFEKIYREEQDENHQQHRKYQNKKYNNCNKNVPRIGLTGKLDELSCEGGELSFVKQMIDESFLFADKIKIFTTMIGVKTDLCKIIDYLNEKNITNFISGDLCQGYKTRWTVGWTHDYNMVLGLVPKLGKTCDTNLVNSFHLIRNHNDFNEKNWKNEFLKELYKANETNFIIKHEILSEIHDQFKILIKVYLKTLDSDEKVDSVEKSKSGDIVIGNIKQISTTSRSSSKLADEEGAAAPVAAGAALQLNYDTPIFICSINAEMLFSNEMLNLKMTYFCGTLGVDECCKWFYSLNEQLKK